MSEIHTIQEENVPAILKSFVASFEILQEIPFKYLVEDFKETFRRGNEYVFSEKQICEWIDKRVGKHIDRALMNMATSGQIEMSVNEEGQFVFYKESENG